MTNNINTGTTGKILLELIKNPVSFLAFVGILAITQVLVEKTTDIDLLKEAIFYFKDTKNNSLSPNSQININAYLKAAEMESNKTIAIDNAKHEILFYGAVMHYTACSRQKSLLDALKKGIHIRILIADPCGEKFEANAAQFGQTVDELKAEADATIKGFENLINKWEKLKDGIASPGSIKVRTIDNIFPSGLYMFDPKDKDRAIMFMMPHVSGVDSPELPGFNFDKRSFVYIKKYRQVFNENWANSKALPKKA